MIYFYFFVVKYILDASERFFLQRLSHLKILYCEIKLHSIIIYYIENGNKSERFY